MGWRFIQAPDAAIHAEEIHTYKLCMQNPFVNDNGLFHSLTSCFSVDYFLGNEPNQMATHKIIAFYSVEQDRC